MPFVSYISQSELSRQQTPYNKYLDKKAGDPTAVIGQLYQPIRAKQTPYNKYLDKKAGDLTATIGQLYQPIRAKQTGDSI